jgi:hypothetical protein
VHKALLQCGPTVVRTLRAYYAPSTWLTPVQMKMIEPLGRSAGVMLLTDELRHRLRREPREKSAPVALAYLHERGKKRDDWAIGELAKIRIESDEMIKSAAEAYLRATEAP